SIFFNGKDITNLKSHQIAQLGIGRTFQTTHLFEQSTVIDSIIIGHRLRTKSNFLDALIRTRRIKEEEELCREIAFQVLEFVGLLDRSYKLVSSISQEEKKRAAIA